MDLNHIKIEIDTVGIKNKKDTRKTDTGENESDLDFLLICKTKYPKLRTTKTITRLLITKVGLAYYTCLTFHLRNFSLSHSYHCEHNQ